MTRIKNYKHYLKIINQVQSVRSKNNVNWMGILKLAFKHAPEETIDLIKKVSLDDQKISNLFKKLTK